MNIQIEVRVTQPPAGAVCVGGTEPRPFTGWLQLLRILSDLLAGNAVPIDDATFERAAVVRPDNLAHPWPL